MAQPAMTYVDSHAAHLAARCSSTAKLSKLPRRVHLTRKISDSTEAQRTFPLSAKLVLPLIQFFLALTRPALVCPRYLASAPFLTSGRRRTCLASRRSNLTQRQDRRRGPQSGFSELFDDREPDVERRHVRHRSQKFAKLQLSLLSAMFTSKAEIVDRASRLA